MGEDDKKSAAPSKFNIISGSQHVIVSKSGLFQVVLLLLAALGGTLIAEKLRLQRNKARQRDLHDAVKDTNKRLVVEKEDYKNIFGCVSVSCGGFTSLRRVVSTRGGAGWFLFRFRADSDRVRLTVSPAGRCPSSWMIGGRRTI